MARSDCRLLAGAASLVVCATTGAALAQAEAAPPRSFQRAARTEWIDFTDRPLTLGYMIGFGTPVGLVGAMATYSIVDPVALGVGAGTNSHGWQLAAMVTLRPLLASGPRGAHAFTITPAWSTGPWHGFFVYTGEDADRPNAQWISDRAHWFQIDGGYELVSTGGSWLRTAWGIGWMLNRADAYCAEPNSTIPTSCDGHEIISDTPKNAILTIVLVFGYAFEI